MDLERYFSLLYAMRKRREVPQIVEESGISIATVYRYLPELQDLKLASPSRPRGIRKRNTRWGLTEKGKDIVDAYF